MVSILAPSPRRGYGWGSETSGARSKNGPGRGVARMPHRHRVDPHEGKAFLNISSTTGRWRLLEASEPTDGTACGLSKIVADAECNGAQCSIAVGKGDGGALSGRGTARLSWPGAIAFLSG